MVTVLMLSVALAQPSVLVDRTLALVGGRTITLSDARVARSLALVDVSGGDEEIVEQLIDRELMLRETERYTPPNPSAEAIEARLNDVSRHAGGDEPLARILDAGGFSEARLRGWIRDDLRIAAYVEQRFALDERRADLIDDWVEDLRRRTPVTVFPK